MDVEQIAVETTAVAVLADGGSTSAVANKRGHLLEDFVARLLHIQGFGEPRTENLNVTAEGIEIDVVAQHRVTGQRLMAECKAYGSNIRVPQFEPFVGKYLIARADDEHLAGIFVGLPRLTPEADEQARKVEAKFAGFRRLSSFEVCKLLVDADLLPPIEAGPSLQSDLTVVISEHGLALAAHELDQKTRRAIRMAVWGRGGVPDPVLDLVERTLARGLLVTAVGEDIPGSVALATSVPTIVSVQGSSSDFEYQLPAAPRFFVGRKSVTSSLADLLTARARGGVLVVNAKSGWGKSSLALRLAHTVHTAGGVALVVDSRTAESPAFVAAALETLVREGDRRKILRLPRDSAFSSLESIVGSLQRGTWPKGQRPLLILFDQFENVFRDEALTRQFRDLALLVADIAAPVTVGFSWKTDLVGWTEDHPYRLRDEIRGAADVAVLDPLGPREVETLLRRLEKAVGGKLHRELRQRLRELSQGLPWLLKKLASHIISEVDRGATQEELVRESLNVQSLFERDLAELSPAEQQGLQTIARSAPALVSELEDVVATPILQSLLNRRLVVQVGERIDTYWDTFRDFLLTGRVAIEESFIVRHAPSSGVAKLLRATIAAGGSLSVQAAASRLGTSPNVIWNWTRELRQLGLVSAEPNRVVVDEEIIASGDRELEVRARVAATLRRHKVVSVVNRLLGEDAGPVPLTRVAAELAGAFPAVEANAESWLTYARAFSQWLAYAGIVTVSREGISRPTDGGGPPFRLLSGTVPVRVRSAFPQGPAGPAEQLLHHLADPSAPRPEDRRLRAALRDLSLLGAVELDERERVRLARGDLLTDGEIEPNVLRRLVEDLPGCRQALELLEISSAASPKDVGEVLRAAYGADWADPTTHSIGKYFRSWARSCGIQTKTRAARTKGTHPGEPTLFLDISTIEAALRTSSDAELAEELVAMLGARLTAYAVGVQDPRTVSYWARGLRAPSSSLRERLRALFNVVRLLQTSETEQAVRAWLLEAQPDLAGRAPIELLREGDFKSVLVGARTFVES
jgi:hypothetical protein